MDNATVRSGNIVKCIQRQNAAVWQGTLPQKRRRNNAVHKSGDGTLPATEEVMEHCHRQWNIATDDGTLPQKKRRSVATVCRNVARGTH
ncbi:hypothetical protein BaRGS_00010398 [Batillaria attramentaria]|uniref:Uncharacterized protein n=1 Tax=Batillaria attramentaria TaxID=370345 RepID=A0ABD0JNG2_9CAEN